MSNLMDAFYTSILTSHIVTLNSVFKSIIIITMLVIPIVIPIVHILSINLLIVLCI